MPINFFTMIFIMIISMSAYSAENTTKTVPKEVADGSHLSANGNTTSTDDGGSERKYIDVDGPIG
ncbi:MAG: hypothetical protein QNK32_00585, partial [Porticoccus sp.]|nr:hypothetical protein [Porticoccus sp.]